MRENKYRNIYCGLIDETCIDKNVRVSGWIENILDHRTTIQPTVNVDVQNSSEEKIPNIVTVQEPTVEVKTEPQASTPTYEQIEKPKINVDVDSVVVNNNNKLANSDFFDDFFGGEDE